MIYLDSSALLKLVHIEQETLALRAWLDARPGAPLVSSELARVEVIRATRRINEAALPTAVAVLAALDLVPMTTELLNAAGAIGGPGLRSLDAIHLASASSIGSALTSFVVYDHRLTNAAAAAGLDTVMPTA
ncbi:type II toxin-antitoxin system VapC family toxin [Georgenia sp. H159]|uniref:type II toxin-antitoxin system VapC family toxin n=1 Tax=Georgenia sp. H159 TaxID=3076115 RepID=UPI002D76AAFB|nr:type II toxin-antitoxin system VapC family toxin [Georgenia sp. H159]